MILRRIARPLLASVFIADGVRALRDPRGELEELPEAEEQLTTIATKVPYLPADATAVIRVAGAAKVAAGVALAVGFVPRVAAATLAVLQLPSSALRHPVWTRSRGKRTDDLPGLMRDGALLGGLLLASADTEGRPSLAWRLDAARNRTGKSVKRLEKKARRKAEQLASEAREQLAD